VPNVSQTECVNGWIEILHFKHNKDMQDLAKISSSINLSNLKSIKEEHYDVVGSPIPLCEYYSGFELYQQYAGNVDPEFNVPRGFKEYDAINLCVNDPNLGQRITTMVIVKKGAHVNLSYRKEPIQFHPDFQHALVIREKPLRSFFSKGKYGIQK